MGRNLLKLPCELLTFVALLWLERNLNNLDKLSLIFDHIFSEIVRISNTNGNYYFVNTQPT